MLFAILTNYILVLIFFQPGQPSITGGTYSYRKNVEKGPAGELLVVPQTDSSFFVLPGY